MYEVTMPKLSDSMEEGKIIEWKVKPGDAVSAGDVIADVESDKAVMELECFEDGTLAEIKHGDDSEVAVGAVIALIDTEGAAEKDASREEREKAETGKEEESREKGKGVEEDEKEEQKDGAKGEAAPSAEPEPEDEPEPEPRSRPAGKPKPVRREPVAATPAPQSEIARSPLSVISPYAKKLADDAGLDYRLLRGSGPDGRIVAKDVEAAIKVLKPGSRAPEKKTPARPDDELPELDVSEDEAELSDMPFRLKTQALRVTHAKHLIPHFYITRGADVTKLLERRAELKKQHGATVTHLVELGVVKAIQANPDVNRSYDRGRIIAWKGVRLGLAVATDSGLNVAVIPHAEELSLPDLIERSKDLVERARAGKLKPDERKHASFTITNLGMYGVEHFEPIINPPSSITLAVSAALDETIVRNNEIFIGKVMRLSASVDHRIVDGAMAAQFLASLVELLENPDELLA
jgi:pyruvate dehydrogenase E2 component (dihydrolipoamide acetyltransferase)